MKRTYTIASIAMAASLLVMGQCAANAAHLIDEFGFEFGFGHTSPSDPPVTYLSLAYTGSGTPSPWPALFENIPVTPSSSGMTFIANLGTDSDFASIATRMTNGLDETISAWYFFAPGLTGSGSGVGSLESAAFDHGNPDLSGFQISEIAMHVDSYNFISGFGGFFDLRFSIFGVPEPSAFAIAATSLSALLAIRRRQGDPTRLRNEVNATRP